MLEAKSRGLGHPAHSVALGLVDARCQAYKGNCITWLSKPLATSAPSSMEALIMCLLNPAKHQCEGMHVPKCMLSMLEVKTSYSQCSFDY
jgi:hypothetical protein